MLQCYLQKVTMLRSLRIIRCIFNGSNFIVCKNDSKVSHYMQDICLKHRMISLDRNCTNGFEVEKMKKPRKKSLRIPKITLINTDNSTSVLLLEEAEKLAKRRNLQLELVSEHDSKTDRSIYKLVSHRGYKDTSIMDDNEISDENKKTNKFKDKQNHKLFKTTKLFTIKGNICIHDLNIKINNINKTLKKHHRVKVVIGHPNGGQEALIEAIRSKVQGTAPSEKSQKCATIITFAPLEETKNDTSQDNVNS